MTAHIGCGAPLSAAAATLGVLATEPSHVGAVSVCPRLAGDLSASLFLQWERLMSEGPVRVLSSCQCTEIRQGPERQSTYVLDARPIGNEEEVCTSATVAASLGLPPAALELAKALDENDRAIANCKDCESGLTGVLIGTGPSLRSLDLRRFDSIPSIGCNKLFLLDKAYHFRPTHLVVEDRLVLEDCAEPLRSYTETSKWFPIDRYGIEPANHYFPLWREYPAFPQFTSNFRR